jgi:hypothetical protein
MDNPTTVMFAAGSFFILMTFLSMTIASIEQRRRYLDPVKRAERMAHWCMTTKLEPIPENIDWPRVEKMLEYHLRKGHLKNVDTDKLLDFAQKRLHENSQNLCATTPERIERDKRLLERDDESFYITNMFASTSGEQEEREIFQ